MIQLELGVVYWILNITKHILVLFDFYRQQHHITIRITFRNSKCSVIRRQNFYHAHCSRCSMLNICECITDWLLPMFDSRLNVRFLAKSKSKRTGCPVCNSMLNKSRIRYNEQVMVSCVSLYI